jgi:GTP-binding protein Era
VIETFEEKDKVFLIEMVILVNKQAHKKIIIGKQGQLLKKIGSEARKEIERILDRQVYLSTYIKVVKPGRRK